MIRILLVVAIIATTAACSQKTSDFHIPHTGLYVTIPGSWIQLSVDNVREAAASGKEAVSYTHLTLPTIYPV